MKKRVFSMLTGAVIACGVMAGCTTPANTLSASPDAFNKALADADALSKAGNQDQAIEAYQKLASADPTREEPWSRIAQIQFQQQHYGQAIVAAQEALQRDQTDRGAKSVLAVAGLRVATESLGELRQDASLQGDAKSDAQALAKQLRDTLGEDSLFPPEQKAQIKKKRYVKRVAKAAPKAQEAADTAAATPAATAPAATTAPAKAAGNGADPFGALRN
ncbi:tetratricopeptide repeat protein [Paraburkholderia sp. J67]|uniref:tetratricopeptide repeat protein n=1 Tax=Paraburkholderia sp. J67 TaxID=2805435 RepID=UPI002ABDE541|nr:tetratricopeptide repeat protein [Paraburkholderia sp. J67]